MKIEFRKIVPDKKPFSFEKGGVVFDGSFKKISSSVVEIDLNFSGSFVHSCDGCAEDFELSVDETSKLFVSDGVYSGDELDVYESFDHFVDFDKICESELETFKSDYHYCKKCVNKFKE
jgi:uncharacterized metal-binding protein YceD (DUF177 family)